MSKKSKTIIISLVVLLICFITVSISYAYWRLTYTQTGINKLVSSCFSMELTNEKNDISLTSAYPISDEKGKELTPYSFTITNTCDLFASYTINLEMLEGTTLDSKYVKTMINSEAITNLSSLETTDTSIEGATESRILFKGSLGSGDQTDYTFRLWMDGDTPPTEESMNQVFQAKITVTGEVSRYSPVANGFTNLAEALLVNEYQTTSLSVAKDKISSKQSVDTSKTAPIIIWQETQNSSTSEFSVTKADASLIGTYGVVENTTKVLLGTSYEFNENTGYYTPTEKIYYDPTTLDYSKDYYLCNSGITATQNNTLVYAEMNTCTTMYKVTGLNSVKESTITLSSGTAVPVNQYTFEVYNMSETELESDKSDKGLYQANDDYGTTYYYRGNVANNYVNFAGHYWKVIRINGDGSVRLLYNGTTATASGSAQSIGSSLFNPERTNPTYVGYMYSNTLDSTYEDTISNDNNSTIKTKLDTWYKTNLEDAGYSSYIADAGFCNDRSVTSTETGTGATSSETTYYDTYYRIINFNPSFSCPNPTNDLFTLVGNSKGNEALTYPIGTITIDELAYAGVTYGYLNKLTYTHSKATYWIMSPFAYRSPESASYIWYSGSNGAIAHYYATSNINVRPVINLKADTEITSGIGTANDPFIVK